MKKTFVQLDEAKWPKTKGRRIDGFRFYEINGKNYQSITTVLGLEKWRQSVGEDAAKWEMARAARRGKATHDLVEQYLKGDTPSIRDVLPLGLFRLLKPYLESINNIHAIEKIMYSHKYTIAGQVDCIAEYNGKLSVIDFKTANKERNDEWNENYYIQCSAYAEMYEELFGTRIDQIVVLMASEDGAVRAFVKDKKDYLVALKENIEYYYKYYQEKTKDKVK